MSLNDWGIVIAISIGVALAGDCPVQAEQPHCDELAPIECQGLSGPECQARLQQLAESGVCHF